MLSFGAPSEQIFDGKLIKLRIAAAYNFDIANKSHAGPDKLFTHSISVEKCAVPIKNLINKLT